LNTIITTQTENGEISFDVYSKLVDSRILFLQGYIDDSMATDIGATLLYMDSQNDNEKISLYINSENGDIRSVFMIYDIMKMIASPIQTLCTGSAFGETALILAAGTKGLRIATKNAIICLTQLDHAGSHYADLSNAEVRLAQSKKDNSKFIAALSENIGKSAKTLIKDIGNDFYMDAKTAKKYGVIDRIL